MSELTIGQLARQAGVGVETVRFYERRGLLEEPPRRPSGYRQYSPEGVSRLRFILDAKQLGFSLREVQELLQLRGGGAAVCSEVRSRVEIKIASLSEKLCSLGRIKNVLEALLEKCRANAHAVPCPILVALDRQEEPCVGCCESTELDGLG